MTTKVNVAHLGIPGSFSHIAAQLMMPGAQYVGYPSFREVLSSLSDGTVMAAVVPIENTLAGSIYENYDLLDELELYISAETNLHIEHHLLVPDGATTVSAIKKVYSHPKALEQCKKFLHAHPHITTVAVSDTAEAARFVSESRDPSFAAIASREAAEIYALNILQGNVEDNTQNFTRFILVKKHMGKVLKSANKCSVAVHLPHQQGSLLGFLTVLNRHGCNLTKIESRPQPSKPFEYIFYVDFIFNQTIGPDEIIRQIKMSTVETKVLGLYASAPLG